MPVATRGWLRALRQQCTQPGGVTHRVAARIVVEVHVHVCPLLLEAADPLRPGLKLRLAEANTVLPTVHAEIRPRRGELLVAWEAPADGQAQRRPRPLEQVIHLRDEPARVAELEGEALGRIGLQRRDEA